MMLDLIPISRTTRGIYDIKGKGPGSMFDRALFLHSEAAESFAQLEMDTGGLVYSDVWRSAEASLRAIREKKGAQPPGYSGHNFGLSVDVAVDATLALRKWRYEELVEKMGEHGWHCHRRDGARGFEDWHFNWLGEKAEAALALAPKMMHAAWSKPVEFMIQAHYGKDFILDSAEVQQCLVKLKLYAGEIDGLLGPRSTEALRVFQRAWSLPESGKPDDRTARTLAFVAAD